MFKTASWDPLPVLDFNFQERKKSGGENLPLEETLIVSLGWAAGRETGVEKLEAGVAELTSKLTADVVELTSKLTAEVVELTSKLTAEVVDELAEEVTMGLVNKYKYLTPNKLNSKLANRDPKYNPEHHVPSAPPKNLFSDESDGN